MVTNGTEWSTLEKISLSSHPLARNQALSTCQIAAGDVVVSVPSLTTVLLPSEKGNRCDECHSRASDTVLLRKCTGCAAYWYCGTRCQSRQWKTHHKKICKAYNGFVASTPYQSLPPHERLDAILLSHLVAGIHMGSTSFQPEDQSSPISTFLSLLPGPVALVQAPVICPSERSSSDDFMNTLYSRFGNNNFAVHSHLVSFAHGIFPLASRLFNHSCAPNAAAKYIITPSEPLRIEVVALREIGQGQEICLSYLDPALSQTRQDIFRLTYGFQCTCVSCTFLKCVGTVPDPPTQHDDLVRLESTLRAFSFPQLGALENPFLLPTRPQSYEAIPAELYPVFNESYLGSLSERFSKASHDGPYDEALGAGVTLLALYVLLYPPNYPQIGMHLLEMAKTAWNSYVASIDPDKSLLTTAQLYLVSSRNVLLVFGQEGDPEGPLHEIEILQRLIDEYTTYKS